MDTVLLFRKRTPLTDDRLPWLRGSEEHPWAARRNASGKGVVSAILVRALLSALEGSVLEVRRYTASPTQPQCYLMGKLQILDIVAEYKRRYPGASLLQMHDDILRSGSLPPRLMRERLFAA